MRFARPARIERSEDGRHPVTFRDFPEDGADEAEAVAEAGLPNPGDHAARQVRRVDPGAVAG